MNAIAPAAVETEMLVAGFKGKPAEFKKLEECHPSRTIGVPEDVARFVKSVTDHTGPFLSGSILEINGGIGGLLVDPG